MSVHHIDVQDTCATAFDGFDLVSQTGKVCRKDRGRDLDVPISIHNNYSRFGVGRGTTGRLFSLTAAGRVFAFAGLFTLARGVAFTFGTAFTLFTLARFTFVGRFVLPFALVLPFA